MQSSTVEDVGMSSDYGKFIRNNSNFKVQPFLNPLAGTLSNVELYIESFNKRTERSSSMTVQILSNDDTVLGSSTISVSDGTASWTFDVALAANSKKTAYIF